MPFFTNKIVNYVDVLNSINSIYQIMIQLLCCVVIILGSLLLVAYAILAERKVLGSIQKRRGPNYVGILGVLQPIADAFKLIVKETIVPAQSNKIIFLIAPVLTLILSIINWSILPFSHSVTLADIRVSILMFFAVSSLNVYGIIMSGWSSNSKYAFLGALRAAAQVVAYEVSIGLTLIYVLIQTGSLNYFEIIWFQKNLWNVVPCFIFFILFFISSLAETNRPPFDLPEAEAELVSGYNVEYSAMAFGFFFLGEYVSIWTVCILNIIMFWGGFFVVGDVPSLFIFSLKVIMLLITFIWVRGSLPRYRYDQLMRLGWKILLPISLGVVLLYAGIYFNWVYDNIKKLERVKEMEDVVLDEVKEAVEMEDVVLVGIKETAESIMAGVKDQPQISNSLEIEGTPQIAVDGDFVNETENEDALQYEPMDIEELQKIAEMIDSTDIEDLKEYMIDIEELKKIMENKNSQI